MGKGCGFPQTFQLLINSYHRQSSVILRILTGHKGQEPVSKDKLPPGIIKPPFVKIIHKSVESTSADVDLVKQVPLTVHITALFPSCRRHLVCFSTLLCFWNDFRVSGAVVLVCIAYSKYP